MVVATATVQIRTRMPGRPGDRGLTPLRAQITVIWNVGTGEPERPRVECSAARVMAPVRWAGRWSRLQMRRSPSYQAPGRRSRLPGFIPSPYGTTAAPP